MPPPDLVKKTQQFVKRVMAVDTWSESCELMGVGRVGAVADDSATKELRSMADFFEACWGRSMALGYAGGFTFRPGGGGVRG